MAVEPRISKIHKSIRRVFNIGKYESLEIVVSFEETVDWQTVADRQKKSDNITKLLLVDFGATKDTVFKELVVGEKKSFQSHALKEPASIENIGVDLSELGLDSLKDE